MKKINIMKTAVTKRGFRCRMCGFKGQKSGKKQNQYKNLFIKSASIYIAGIYSGRP